MRFKVRYLLAVAGSSIGGLGSIGLGFYVYVLGARDGWPHLLGYTTVILGVLGAIIIPTYLTKRLLVDYW